MYKLSNEERQQYGSIILLNEMVNSQNYFSIFSTGNKKHIEPLLKLLNKHDLIKVQDDKYIPTEKGREHLLTFYKKYWEFVRMYDLFCAVDLENGTFAFSEFFNTTDEEWSTYLKQDNWEDVRLAVCEFKGINPIEVVFMSFINEGRFDLNVEGWEFDLVSGLIWDEILHVCNNNLTVKQLEDNDTDVKIMIEMGASLAKDLFDQEKERNEMDAELEEEEDEEESEIVEEYYVEVIEEDVYYYNDDYYEPFYDPYYVSPYWIVPILYVGLY